MRWLLLALLLPAASAAEEFEIRHGGSHPPDPAALELVRTYVPHWIAWTAAIVMTRTPEGWKVAADIVGQEPDPPPHPLASE